MEGQSKDLRGLTGHPLHFARELGSAKLHPGLAQMKGRGKVHTQCLPPSCPSECGHAGGAPDDWLFCKM